MKGHYKIDLCKTRTYYAWEQDGKIYIKQITRRIFKYSAVYNFPVYSSLLSTPHWWEVITLKLQYVDGIRWYGELRLQTTVFQVTSIIYVRIVTLKPRKILSCMFWINLLPAYFSCFRFKHYNLSFKSSFGFVMNKFTKW